MSDYTPSTDEVREAWRTNPDGPKRLGSRFDRWLESVRAEERERIAQDIEADANHDVVRNATLATAARIAREGA